MLLLLINVGRMTVLIAAAITIISAACIGWLGGANLDIIQYNFTQASVPTPNRLLFAGCGLLAGFLLAGSVFGLVAAVFDMQRSLRTLAKDQQSTTSDEDRQDGGLLVRGVVRSEPRLSNALALIVTILAISMPASAQDRNNLVRCKAIADNGARLFCYDKAVQPPLQVIKQEYRAMRLAELKVDIGDLLGSKVEVPGFMKLVNGDVAFLWAGETSDGIYIPVYTSRLSRDLRLLLVTQCVNGCSVITRGRAGTSAAGFSNGIIADSFEVIK